MVRDQEVEKVALFQRLTEVVREVPVFGEEVAVGELMVPAGQEHRQKTMDIREIRAVLGLVEH